MYSIQDNNYILQLIIGCQERLLTKLAAEPWQTTLFLKTPKSRFEGLLDILLALPHYLSQLSNFRCGRTAYKITDIQALFQNALNVKCSLEEWFKLFRQEEAGSSNKAPPFQTYICEDGSDHSTGTYLPTMRVYRDDIAAEEICVFNVGMILILSILRDASLPSATETYNKQMASQADFILSAV
jgi:hypothetical protein